MEWLETLLRFDGRLFLQLNALHTPWWDTAMLFFTRKESWLPLYLLLIWLVVRNYGARSWYILVFMVIGLVVSDQGTGIIKELVGRPRPGHDPAVSSLTHIVLRKGGDFGFPSSHASNTFFVLVFTGYLFRNRLVFLTLLLWALLVSWSRIYVGAHFPLDLMGGWLFGALTGWGFYRLMVWGETRSARTRKAAKAKPLPAPQAGTIPLVLATLVLTLLTAVYILHKYDFL